MRFAAVVRVGLLGLGLLVPALPAEAQWFAAASISTAKPAEGRPTAGVSRVGVSTAMIYGGWVVVGAHKGQVVEGAWVAVDSRGAAPPNYVIDKASYNVPANVGDQAVWGDFSISRPDNGWPPGTYRLEIRLSGTLVATTTFTIE